MSLRSPPHLGQGGADATYLVSGNGVVLCGGDLLDKETSKRTIHAQLQLVPTAHHAAR